MTDTESTASLSAELSSHQTSLPIEEAKQLKSDIEDHLREIGLWDRPENAEPSKQNIRDMHADHRKAAHGRIYKALGRDRIRQYAEQYIAEGRDVIPSDIEPELELVESGKKSGDMFRFATLFWSVPVSLGYGRRMRYLVWDRQNDKLIGAFALCDPVFNLKDRDVWVGWDQAGRRERLVHTMSAYVTGALPPYRNLLGGKLVTALIGAREVGLEFEKRYGETTGRISQQRKNAQLTLVTFTSALGRSSLYNRLRLYNGSAEPAVFLKRLGYTEGFGHFQLTNEHFERLKSLLDQEDERYSPRMGTGPNWRIRVARVGLKAIGFDDEDIVLKHGIRREVFVMPIADNTVEFLRGSDSEPRFENRHSVKIISDLAKDRWTIPRAERNQSYLNVAVTDVLKTLQCDNPQFNLEEDCSDNETLLDRHIEVFSGG